MYLAEDKHWWYTGLRNLLERDILAIVEAAPNCKLLDAGCGTGGDLAMLKRVGDAYGFDISSEALDFCAKRGQRNLAKGSIMHIPFDSNVFQVALTTDVLYHKWVSDDVAALRELHRVIKPGGTLLLHTAAFEFLRGDHDKVVYTRHRYTAAELRRHLEASGFDTIRITYRNMMLAPIVLIHRLLTRFISRGEQSDIKVPSPPINRVLEMIVRTENSIVRHLKLPFGVSLYCSARKPVFGGQR